MRNALTLSLLALVAVAGCAAEGNFGDDVAFLRKHVEVLELTGPSRQARVAVVPAYQGRVMTSTFAGADGPSLGWINYELIASGKTLAHMNPYGGEDRFWMGPEGGQYAIFFAPGTKFALEDWQTPAVIDTEAWDVLARGDDSVSFRNRAKLTNQSGTTFDVQMDRRVVLLSRDQAAGALNAALPAGVKVVAYESDNRITNVGAAAWDKAAGLLSIWILGMYKPTPTTTVVIPFVAGPREQLGPKVNDAYFGKVPADRLIVKDDVLFFRCDGKYRSKIGLSPKRAKSIAGCYDAAGRVLTLVQYNKPDGATDYVNSMWEVQAEPYGGDAINSYNDGPTTPGGRPLGPFCELETSSPAAALGPNEAIRHVHRTIHLHGSEADLDAIARKTLGVGLKDIAGAFAQ